MARAKSLAPASEVEGAPGSVRIYTLGRFEVELDGEPLRFASKAKRRPLELLKVLIALGGEGTSVVQLTESLWPDSDGDLAYGSFTVNLNRLRQLIGRDCLQLQDNRLHLGTERCWVDAREFARLLGAAAQAVEEQDGDRAWRDFEKALDLYRGPFLDGEFDPPEILNARERLHSLFLRHVDLLGNFYREKGQFQQAAVLYQRALEADDLAEELYRNLMGCYLRLGRLAECAAVYERCRQIFRANVDSDPSPQTEAIHRELLDARGKATAPAEPQAAPGAAVPPFVEAPQAEEPPPPLAGEGERRPATIAFCDFSGYTALNEKLDPEEVKSIIGRIKEGALRIVGDHGGIVNQFIGDEVLALFGIPRSHEDDPQRAVRCALSLHEFVRKMGQEMEDGIDMPLRLHSGISTGLIVAHAGDSRDGRYEIVGNAVVLGARLASRSGADEILVCPDTHRLIDPYFQTEALKPMALKGKSEPLVAHRVIGESRMRDRFEVAEQRGFTPYTGREQELAILRDSLDKACAGQGQIVTVVGEAGMGKSRLLFEFRHSLEPGRMIELQGHCRPDGTNTPYLPFLDSLRRGLRLREEDDLAEQVEKVVRNLRAIDTRLARYIPVFLHLLSLKSEDYPLPPRLEGEELRTAIEEALAAIITMNVRHKPMLVMLENWDWADEASIKAMHSMMGIIAHYPLMMVINYRPEYPAQWGNMSHHTHIGLKPLDEAHTERIASAVMGVEALPEGLPEVIQKHTEGNPFFIEELCRALVEEGTVVVKNGRAALARPGKKLTFPDNAQAVVRTRLDRLDEPALNTLRLASVIGLNFGQEVLKRISEAPQRLPQSLETLKTMELIQQVDVIPEATYRFHHAITQSVAYESLLLQRRKELHEGVGKAIEELFAGRLEEHYEVLAHHYRNSGNTEKALQALEQAGDKAYQYFSLVDAREHYLAAMGLLKAAETTEETMRRHIDLAVKWGTVSFYSPSQEILRALETSLEFARELKDRARIVNATFWVGMMNYALGNHAAALARYQACLDMEQVVANPQLHALIVNYMGRNYFYMAEFPRGIAQLKEGIPMLEKLDRKAEALNSMGILLLDYALTGEFDKGEALVKKILKGAKTLGNPNIEAMGYLSSGMLQLIRGDWSRSAESLKKARHVSGRSGNSVLQGMSTWGIGYSTGMLGTPDGGFALMHEGIDIVEATESELGLSIYYAFLAQRYAQEGEVKEATAHANRALKLCGPSGGKLGEYIAHAALAIASAAKDWKKAEASMKKSLQVARDRGLLSGEATVTLFFAELYKDKGDTAMAKGYADEAAKLFRKMGMEGWLKDAKKLQRSLPKR